jgi:hypothetical protein
MSDFVPFITGRESCRLITQHYGDVRLARVGAYQLDYLKDRLPSARLWIDAGVDGLARLNETRAAEDSDEESEDQGYSPWEAWKNFVTSFKHCEKVADPAFQSKPDKLITSQFVKSALDACLVHRPAVVSIPQLPRADGSEVNKINKIMAEAASKWQVDHPKVTLILPVILNHGDHSLGKVARNAHVKQATQCLQASKAYGVWIVDASFDDESQKPDTRGNRIRGLISFHKEFNAAMQGMNCKKIAGPYWGLNILLWSRGLVDRIGISIGSGYQYRISGGFVSNKGAARIAIDPLFRRAKVGVKLNAWFQACLADLEPSHPFHSAFLKLKPLATRATKPIAREQVAIFYRKWLDQLAATPSPGRGMALFQSLSIAFSYGKLLESELDEEGATRRPESIAEPLMLNCL